MHDRRMKRRFDGDNDRHRPYPDPRRDVNQGKSKLRPVDWLSQAQAYAPGKTLIIAGSPAWQAGYLQKLLAEADRLNVAFTAWFSIVDFDNLWQDTLGQDPLVQSWKDKPF